MTLAAIVLAAGAGTRFGGDKLSALFRGEPLIAHAIRAARAAPVARVVVVCPPALDIGEWPGEPAVQALRISSPELSASLKAGLRRTLDPDWRDTGKWAITEIRRLMQTADAKESAAAFIEKRTPVFTGN